MITPEERLAARVRDAGLAAPAILWLGTLRPLSFVGGQALRLLDPLWSSLSPADDLRLAADVLEDRDRLDRFLDLLDPRADGADA